MENIMIINEVAPFRDGLKSLMELRFGSHYKILGFDSKNLNNMDSSDRTRLVIVDNPSNPTIEGFISSMRAKGTKVVLLGNKPESITGEDELSRFNGFLIKNMPTNELLDAIDEVIAHDRVYVHPEIGYFFLQKLINRKF